MATIKKVENGPRKGKWRLRAGAQGKIDKYFDTKADATQWLNDNGTRKVIKPSVWTLNQLVEWLETNLWGLRGEQSTRSARKGRYRIYVQTDWGNHLLDQIDPMEFQEWINKVAAAGVGASTVSKIKSDLVQTWNEGLRFGKCSRMLANPFQATTVTPVPRIAVVLAPSEAMAAFQKLTGNRRTFFALGTFGGLRMGEILAFRRQQIHEGFMLIDSAIKKRPERLGLPKKDKVRQAVLCNTLKTVLESLQWQGEFCLRQQTQDHFLTRKQAYGLWNTVLEEGRLPKEFDTHDMRLNHINWLEKMAPEVSGTTLQEHVGHSSGGVTQQNYTRPLTLSQESLACALDRIFDCAFAQLDKVS